LVALLGQLGDVRAVFGTTAINGNVDFLDRPIDLEKGRTEPTGPADEPALAYVGVDPVGQ
jgi:hypothetical protein